MSECMRTGIAFCKLDHVRMHIDCVCTRRHTCMSVPYFNHITMCNNFHDMCACNLCNVYKGNQQKNQPYWLLANEQGYSSG